MKLRNKTLLVLGVVFVLSLFSFYAVSRGILLDNFGKLETDIITKEVRSLQGVLSTDVLALSRFNADWAGWDDSYKFVNDLNEEYKESNLVDDTFIGSHLSVMVFFNASGTPVYAKSVDLNTKRDVPVSDELLNRQSDDPLIKYSELGGGNAGFILLQDGLMLVASHPIITSYKEGPIRGVLLMGRYFDFNELALVAERTNVSLKLYDLYDFLNKGRTIPSDFQDAYNSMIADKSDIEVVPLSENIIAGYALIRDIYGNPAAVIRLERQRSIYEEGKNNLNYFFVAVCALLVLFGGINLLLLEWLVLSKINRLSNNVNKIRVGGDFSTRMPLEKGADDEFTSLSLDINNMLSVLEQAQGELRANDAKYRALLENAMICIVIVDVNGKILTVNPAGLKLFEIEKPEEWNGKLAFSFLSKDSIKPAAEVITAVGMGKSRPPVRFNIITAKGREIPIETFAARITFGGESAVLLMMREVSGNQNEAPQVSAEELTKPPIVKGKIKKDTRNKRNKSGARRSIGL